MFKSGALPSLFRGLTQFYLRRLVNSRPWKKSQRESADVISLGFFRTGSGKRCHGFQPSASGRGRVKVSVQDYGAALVLWQTNRIQQIKPSQRKKNSSAQPITVLSPLALRSNPPIRGHI